MKEKQLTRVLISFHVRDSMEYKTNEIKFIKCRTLSYTALFDPLFI